MFDEIDEIFQKNDTDANEIRKDLILYYNALEKKEINFENFTVEEAESIAKWLNLNECIFLGYKAKNVKQKFFFINETEKLSYLKQRACPICGDLFPIANFPARIKPQTRQSKKSVRREFKANFSKSTSFSNLGFESNNRLCVRIIFVLNNVRDKDLDNMAKITLDSMKDLLKIDDKKIDHLDLLKIKAKFIESHIIFQIGKSQLNTKEDIILSGTNLKWGVDKLD